MFKLKVSFSLLLKWKKSVALQCNVSARLVSCLDKMAATLPLGKSAKEIEYNYSNQFNQLQPIDTVNGPLEQFNSFPSPSPAWLNCTFRTLLSFLQSNFDLVKVHAVIFIHLILIALIALIIVLCCLIQVAQESLQDIFAQNCLAIKLRHWIKRVFTSTTVDNGKSNSSSHPLIVAVMINATSRCEAINNVTSCLGVKVRETVSYSLLAREPFIYQEHLPRYLAFFANCQYSTRAEASEQGGPDIEVIKICNFSSKNTVKNISNVSSYLVAFKCRGTSEMKNIVNQLGYQVTESTNGINLRLVNSSDENAFLDTSNGGSNCARISPGASVTLPGDLSKWQERSMSMSMSMAMSMVSVEKTKKYTAYFNNKHADTVVKVFSWLKRLFALMETAHMTFATLAKELTRHLYANWNRKPSSTTDLFTSTTNRTSYHRPQQVQYFNCNRLPCGPSFDGPPRAALTCKSLTLAIADCLPTDLMALIRGASKWTDDEIVITLIASAIKSYVQVVTGECPSNIEAFVESPEMAHILLPLESADDLISTGSFISHQLRSNLSLAKDFKKCHQLPNFLSNCIYKLCKSNNPVVFKATRLSACSNVLMSRCFYSWSQMQEDNCLRFDVIHSIDSSVICISARKDAVQSASLLAECIAKSLLNLCISLSISYDRRTPPSSPQDTTREVR